MAVTAIIYTFIAISVSLYVYLKWCHSYWERRGVPTSLKPVHLLYGSNKDLQKMKKPTWEYPGQLYHEFKSRGLKHGGFYSFNLPTWLPVDYELVKNILTRDFTHFMNHMPGTKDDYESRAKSDLFTLNIFGSNDEKWKKLRAKLTPAFTSGKLKMMFHTLLATTENLKEVLDSHQTVKDPVDIKDVISRFTTDVIGSCAFGLDCNSLKNPESEFRKYGSRIAATRPSGLKKYLFILKTVLPSNLRWLIKANFFEQDVEDFFKQIVNQTVNYRETNNVFRKDFLHLLIQLKNKGKLTDDESLLENPNEATKFDQSLTMMELIAQCIFFFLAGYETSATTMSFAMLEMVLNPEVQDKLRTEINEVLRRYDGKITYESVMEMKYLELVIHETLRMHPPLPSLPRVCSKDYKIPGTDIVIERGTQVQIPVMSIHYDPEIYPNPKKFDPERFTEENKAKRPACTFLSFGEGPRFCIGARFGLMQVKVGLITVIKNFKISLSSKTQIPITYQPKAFFPAVEGDIWLDVDKIESE